MSYKISYFDIKENIREHQSIAFALKHIQASPNVMMPDDAEKHFLKTSASNENMSLQDYFNQAFSDRNDNFLFAICRSRSYYLIGEKGSVTRLLMPSKGNILMPIKKDEELDTLTHVLKSEQENAKQQNPDYVIEKDFQRRKQNFILQRQSHIEQVKNDTPEDFWDALRHIADKSICYEEFAEIIHGSYDPRDLSNRNIGRISRATYALDEPNKTNSREVTIYRALPIGYVIEEGDWVSTSEGYASSHECNSPSGTGITISMNIRMDELYETSSVDELVYVPNGTWKGFDSLESVWDSLNQDNKPRNYPCIEKRTIGDIMREQKSSFDPTP